MKKFAMGLVALVLLIAVSPAHGSVLTFTATGPGSKPGETLHASATFAISNLDLIVTLSNTGTYDSKDAADILSAILFKIDNGGPKLTPVSAELVTDSSVISHPLPMGFDGDVGGEWAYRNSLTNTPEEAIASDNLKNWFGKSDFLFPGPDLNKHKGVGGVDFGLTTLDDLPGNNKGGIKNQGLIQASVVFTFAGLPEGFKLSDITDVTFQYGTNLKQPDITGEAIAQIPEPGTISLVAAGLLGALTLVRRRISPR